MIAELHHLERGIAAERIWKLLKAFDMLEAVDRQIETLSKGMRQKVLLTSVLIHDPQVLLLDEPLTSLDANAALTFRRLLANFLERGKTILFCSHVLEVVERLCTRVLIIDHGRIVADDTTARLLASHPEGTLEGVFQALTRAAQADEWTRAFLDVLPSGGGNRGFFRACSTSKGKEGTLGKVAAVMR